MTNKILIIRLSAIGDIVMASPVARAVKSANPDCEIHWLTEPVNASLLEDDPSVDKVIHWPRQHWTQLLKEKRLIALTKQVKALRSELCQERYEMAIDLQGLLKSGFFAWLSGAKQKIGLGSREGSQWLMDKTIPRNLGDQDLIGSEYRTIIDQLGCAGYPMALTFSEKNQQSTNHLLDSLKMQKPFLALCPFTTRPQKHWLDSHWQTLANILAKANQYELLMLGGPSDLEHANILIGDRPIHNLVGKTNLQQTAAIVSQAAGVIGVDTGITHMGHAAKKPTVAIFGSTRPYLKTELDTSKIIYRERSCSPCKRNPTCDGRFDCMREITPEDAFAELAALLPSLAANQLRAAQCEEAQ